MENKSNKSKWIIIILVIIIICMAIYYCFDKGYIKVNFSGNNTSTSESTEAKEEDISFTDSKFINIYNDLGDSIYNAQRTNGYSSFTLDDLKDIVALYLKKNLKENDFTKTSEKDEWGRFYYTYKGSFVDDVLKELFGTTIKYDKSSLLSNGVMLSFVMPDGNAMMTTLYDATTDTYKCWFGGSGGTSGNAPIITKRVITSAKIKDNTITLVEKAIYYDVDYASNTTYKIYSDLAKKNLIDTKTYDESNADTSKQTISVEDYGDKVSTITSTYKLDNTTNTYYFAGSTIK